MAAPLSVATTGGGVSNQRLLKTIAGAVGGHQKDIQKSRWILRKKGGACLVQLFHWKIRKLKM